MTEFKRYRRKAIAELRPWEPGEDLSGVSISFPDEQAGSPRAGDMIARNPKDHTDQWLVAAAYFADNFEPVDPGGAAAYVKAVNDLLGVAGARLPAGPARRGALPAGAGGRGRVSWTRSREEFLDGTHLAMSPEYRSPYWYGYDSRAADHALSHGEKAAVRRRLEALAKDDPGLRLGGVGAGGHR